jgi:hypothetical protein
MGRSFRPRDSGLLSLGRLLGHALRFGFLGRSTNLYAYVDNATTIHIDPLGLVASSCCSNTWTNCWASCIEKYRLNYWQAIPFLPVPKILVPPFRVVVPTQRMTTVLSSIGNLVGGGGTALGGALRGIGRVASPIATALTLGEGAWDGGVLIVCAELCRRDKCKF